MTAPVSASAPSQSPDGDFFDPETAGTVEYTIPAGSHSPLTGIFLIRRECAMVEDSLSALSQSPDGDFFDPERPMKPSNQ